MMTLEEATTELATYVGLPKCQDCQWKLGSAITDHCSCNPEGQDDKKHAAAFARARELQMFVATANIKST